MRNTGRSGGIRTHDPYPPSSVPGELSSNFNEQDAATLSERSSSVALKAGRNAGEIGAAFSELMQLVDVRMVYDPATAGVHLPMGMLGCLQYRVTATRNNAKKLKRRFTLTTPFIVDMYLAQKGLCAVSGLPMMPETTQKFSDPFAPSIDRLDNDKGYVRNNVRLVCRIANFAMSVWGEVALIHLARAIVKKHPEAA